MQFKSTLTDRAKLISLLGCIATGLVFLPGQSVEAQNRPYNLPPGSSMPGTAPAPNSGTNGGMPNGVPNNAPNNAVNSGVNQILATYGLVTTNCVVGVVQIRLSIEQVVCAIPTAQFPSGLYMLNQQDFSIRPIGNSTPGMQQPGGGGQPQPTYPANSIPSTIPPTTTPPIITPPPTGPAILFVNNPSQPVPADVTAQVSAFLAGRGLTLVSCSANPGVVVTVGSYMACAYPTATYPAGRYTLR